MDVFLMIRRKKSTIFLDVKETTTVKEIKLIVEGILRIEPENQQLTNEGGIETFVDEKTIGDYVSASQAHAQSPVTVGLCLRQENGDFETLVITSLSAPPELPEVMKPQDPTTIEQT